MSINAHAHSRTVIDNPLLCAVIQLNSTGDYDLTLPLQSTSSARLPSARHTRSSTWRPSSPRRRVSRIGAVTYGSAAHPPRDVRSTCLPHMKQPSRTSPSLPVVDIPAPFRRHGPVHSLYCSQVACVRWPVSSALSSSTCWQSPLDKYCLRCKDLPLLAKMNNARAVLSEMGLSIVREVKRFEKPGFWRYV